MNLVKAFIYVGLACCSVCETTTTAQQSAETRDGPTSHPNVTSQTLRTLSNPGANESAAELPPPLDFEAVGLDRPLDRPLACVYEAVKYTLECVQEHTWTDFERDVGPVSEAATWSVQLPRDGDKVKRMLMHWVGYTVCVALGILLLLLIPIGGCCFCCCRVCGYCRSSPRETSRSGYALRVLTIVMVVLTVLLAAGVVSLFIASVLVGQQLRDPQEGTVPTVNTNLKHINGMRRLYTEETRDQVVHRVVNATEVTMSNILDLPDTALARVDALSHASQYLDLLASFASDLDDISAALEDVNGTTNRIVEQEETLCDSLGDVKLNITKDLSIRSCSKSTSDIVGNMTVEINFRNVYQMDDVIETVEDAMSLENAANKISADFEHRKFHTKLEMLSKFASLLHKISLLSNRTQTAFSNVTNDLETNINLTAWTEGLDTVQTRYLDAYGGWVFYSLLGLSSVLLLSVLAFLLGLSCGVCGRRANKKNECCHRGRAASLLSCGLGIFWMFSGVVSVVSLVGFLVGGLAYTEACRYLLQPDLREQLFPIADTLIYDYGHVEFRTREAMERCQSNHTVYTVFEEPLDALGFNVTALTNVNTYGLVDEVNNITHSDITLGTISIVTSEIEHHLISINERFNAIKWQSYEDELDKDVINFNISSVVESLCECDKSLAIYNDSLFSLQPMVDQIKLSMIKLQSDLSKAKKLTEKINLYDLLEHLRFVERFINDNSSGVLDDEISATLEEVLLVLSGTSRHAVHSVRHDIGHCRPIHDDVMSGVAIVCVRFLYPFDAFCFCLGTSLVLMAVGLVVALKLASLYKKTVPYYLILEQERARKAAEEVSLDDAVMRYEPDIYSGQSNPAFGLELEPSRELPPPYSVICDDEAQPDSSDSWDSGKAHRKRKRR